MPVSGRCTCGNGEAEEDRGAVLACSVHGIGRDVTPVSERAYFNDTPVAVLDRRTIGDEACVLVEWPNQVTAHSGVASRSWLAADEVRPEPRSARNA